MFGAGGLNDYIDDEDEEEADELSDLSEEDLK